MNKLNQNEIAEKHGDALAEILQGLHEAQQHFLARLDMQEAAISRVLGAFPGKDPESHCRYHDALIADMAERKKLRQAVQEKTISGLVWSGIVACATALYHYFVKAPPQ